MHMSDALLSPPVAATCWAVSGGALAWASQRLGRQMEDRTVPLMGVMGAFVFAAQMINFTIPGTGSSGHLAGTTLLAFLLGPHAAFITIASVLTIQALLFADGGLLALGANLINMGLIPCYLVFPLLRTLIPASGKAAGPTRVAAFLTAVLALQAGAFLVVVETTLSGISELPFTLFALVMQPIHLAIGVVEGVVTVGVLGYLWRLQPEMAPGAVPPAAPAHPWRGVAALLLAALFTGGVLSWYASSHPDGLEWSIARVSGQEELTTPASSVHATAAQAQEHSALLPDYALPGGDDSAGGEEAWGAANAGTSLSGVMGGLISLLLAGSLGWLLRRRSH